MSVKKMLLQELTRFVSINGRYPKYLERLSIIHLRHLLRAFQNMEEQIKSSK